MVVVVVVVSCFSKVTIAFNDSCYWPTRKLFNPLILAEN